MSLKVTFQADIYMWITSFPLRFMSRVFWFLTVHCLCSSDLQIKPFKVTVTGTAGNPRCCEEGRGWRLCEGGSDPDAGGCRTGRAATGSRDLGRRGQMGWVILLSGA